MGNRTELGMHVPVINPPEFPYLHIVSHDRGTTYAYVPSLEGAKITVGRISNEDHGRIEYLAERYLETPLLPGTLAELPPTPIHTETHVAVVLQAYEEILIELIEATGSNMLACLHGSYWGLLPEKKLTSMLRDNGYKVSDTYPKVGGRKRIQEHGIILG